MSTTKQVNEAETGPSAGTLEEAHELGFIGTVADPEPNESYTLEGVTAAAKTQADDSASSSSSSGSSSSSSGSSKSSGKSSGS